MSSVSSFANAMPTIARKNDLLKWIQQEERLVRIYQADLAVTQRKHQQQHRGEDPPDDWLETLDRLQSNDNSNSLDTKWHDDPIHRLLPRISGVQFTHIVQNQQQQQQQQQQQTELQLPILEFHATISAAGATKLQFMFRLTVQETRMTNLTVTILNKEQHDSVELYHTTQQATESNNVPQLVRRLVEWAKFDARRRILFQALVDQYPCCTHASPTTLSLVLKDYDDNIDTDTDIDVVVLLTWTLKSFGREVVTYKGKQMADDNAPLQDLLTCCGSVETAFHLICRAVEHGTEMPNPQS